MNFKEQIKKYQPVNEQEEMDKRVMLDYIQNFDNILLRENEFAHFSASAWCINKERTKVLMIYHNIYQSWAWSGGHADGEEDLKEVAIREIKEETGIEEVIPLIPDIFSLEIVTVDGHEKKGKYVSSHLHLNCTYLLEADENQSLKIKEDENSGVKWIKLEEVKDFSTEEWIIKRCYNKMIQKLKEL